MQYDILPKNSVFFLVDYKILLLGGGGTTFNPSTWEAGVGRFLSLIPVWKIEQVPGQPVLHRETLSQKQRNKQTKIYNSLIYSFLIVDHYPEKG